MTTRVSSSSSTSYTRFSNARSGRQRPVERRPPASTASSTRSGVRPKNVFPGSPATPAIVSAVARRAGYSRPRIMPLVNGPRHRRSDRPPRVARGPARATHADGDRARGRAVRADHGRSQPAALRRGVREGHALRPARRPGRDRGRHAQPEVEVLSLKPDKPVCQLRATIVNQDGTTLLEGECWTYTMRPV